MNLDISSLTNTMTEAVRGAVGDRWSTIRAIAEPELRKLAQTLEDVNQLHASGEISTDRAQEHVRMQLNAAQSVIQMVRGIGLLTARDALGAAARAAGEVVNRLIGFKLI